MTVEVVEIDRQPYKKLRLLTATFFDFQEARIRIENRAGRAVATTAQLNEGSDRLTEDDVREQFDTVLKNGKITFEHRATREAEHQAGLDVLRQYRKTAPAGVRAWQTDHRGIGDHLVALLLGYLGHPRVAIPHHWEGRGPDRKLVEDEPYIRTQAQLRAYCGMGDVNRKTFPGIEAEDAFRCGSPSLKKIVYQLAEACGKQPGTPISVLLGTDHLSCVSHHGPVGVEVPSTVNGDQRTFDPHTRSVAVDGISSTGSDQIPLDLHAGRVTAGGELCGATMKGREDLCSRPAGSGTDHLGKGPCHFHGGQPTPHYRLIYEQRRLATQERPHEGLCVRCGPSGHPAAPGSPWSAKHQHADGLRIVGKEILDDLWTAAAL